MNTYHIKPGGQVDENEINTTSPLQMSREREDRDVSRFMVRTDQSGLIGLMRYLHGRGYIILAITCEQGAG